MYLFSMCYLIDGGYLLTRQGQKQFQQQRCRQRSRFSTPFSLLTCMYSSTCNITGPKPSDFFLHYFLDYVYSQSVSIFVPLPDSLHFDEFFSNVAVINLTGNASPYPENN